jgi:hypothetical protein
MKVLIPYIFLSFFLITSCNKDKSGSSSEPLDSATSKNDSLPVGKGTESTVESDQGIGTSENGLSTDVAEDSVLKKESK